MMARSTTAPADGPRLKSNARSPSRAIDLAALRMPLQEGLLALQVDLPSQAGEQLLAYLALLVRWNGTYNLTAVRDPQQMLVQHLLDSLSVVAPLSDTLDAANAQPIVIDVGSGAGLPGIVLALAWPHARVTMVEPVGKKAAFIQQAIGELGLHNAQVRAARIEHVALDSFPIAPDLVICRAYAALADFTRSIEHLTEEKCTVAAMKGQVPRDEIDALPAHWAVTSTIALRVPMLAAQRHLLLLHRTPVAS